MASSASPSIIANTPPSAPPHVPARLTEDATIVHIDSQTQIGSSAVRMDSATSGTSTGAAASTSRTTMAPVTITIPPLQTREEAQQEFARQLAAVRPWWRPPARSFRPHPGNRAITSFAPTTTLTVAPDSPTTPARVENVVHYGWRVLNYVLRIPFREMLGNIMRPYDPTAPLPLPDVPLYATIIDTRTNQRFGVGRARGTSGSTTGRGEGNSDTPAPSDTSSGQPSTTMTGDWEYLPQVRKAWAERTPSMSWPLSTAFFTSILATVLAITALGLNWHVPCTYLKVYLLVFVVRKWIVTCLMFDRALYRLPLGLTEPDPDIDEERHNGIATYMAWLFTWHGYAMFVFGTLYVYVYGFSQALSTAPVIAGVAMVFACMGLTPFFALLSLMLLTMALLYLLFLCLMCAIWPCERLGLTRRRAISRRNGGYQSDGTTNTTDLRQVAQVLENGGESTSDGPGDFGGVDPRKITPAMAAIPIIIFRKRSKAVAVPATSASEEVDTMNEKGRPSPGSSLSSQSGIEAVTAVSSKMVTESLRPSTRTTAGTAASRPQNQQRPSSRPTTVLIASLSPQSSTERLEGGITPSSSSSGSKQGSPSRRVSRVLNDLTVTIPSVPSCSHNDSQTDAINRMPFSLSTLYSPTAVTPTHDHSWTEAAKSRSRSASLSLAAAVGSAPGATDYPSSATLAVGRPRTVILSSRPLSQASSLSSLNPCASVQEMNESEQRRLAVITQQQQGTSPIGISGVHPPSSTETMMTTPIATSGLNVLNHLDRAYIRANTPLSGKRHLHPPSSENASIMSIRAASTASTESSSGCGDGEGGEEGGDNYPIIQDEECAICLFDFEDGEQLRHLPCDHFFHLSCVDRWLVKNAFCPKCKRSI
ncbi:hypothetical protein EMPS_09703 [Entomortierella parvispora]|uniref:RING-type E3 ubiquitin transferase n=1 Tax=Entomortierella parvispora TaxID=205924 RepID=A0A9P3HIG4_9FUNG|nr:hypothetical protein EMPS_09703 [Entomortierella parvispora]